MNLFAENQQFMIPLGRDVGREQEKTINEKDILHIMKI